MWQVLPSVGDKKNKIPLSWGVVLSQSTFHLVLLLCWKGLWPARRVLIFPTIPTYCVFIVTDEVSGRYCCCLCDAASFICSYSLRQHGSIRWQRVIIIKMLHSILLGRFFDRVDLIKPVSNVRPSVHRKFLRFQ